MLTEQQNPNTTDIDRLSTLEMLGRINDEDRTVADAVRGALPQIAQAVDAITVRLRDGGRLIYSGAGTSGRLGVLDAVECVPTYSAPPGLIVGVIAGGNPALTRSVENAEDDAEAGAADLRGLELSAKDCVVGIAASGRTPYVLGAIAYAREVGAFTAGIACNAPAPLLDAADVGIGVPVGPEVITGSTRMKAGTAQKMILNMLSTSVMIKMGKVYGNLMVDVQVTNEKLARRARQLVCSVTGADSATADDLLRQADQQVKVAILMHKFNLSAPSARAKLAEAGDTLHPLID
ncbi:MAG: N-acetylmuramic acid 6-phosphate etherase [Anaerolineaceae bacterium]|nr:MAG: N-acetylmuramic acid 6-phosphate etherase [Anaerolineaceae bacterium]